jgi:hypothetical protein
MNHPPIFSGTGPGRLFATSKFPLRHCSIGNAPIQTLSYQEAEFTLRHSEPTAVLGRTVKLQSIEDSLGFPQLEYSASRSQNVDVESIRDHGNTDRIGTELFAPVSHAVQLQPQLAERVSPCGAIDTQTLGEVYRKTGRMTRRQDRTEVVPHWYTYHQQQSAMEATCQRFTAANVRCREGRLFLITARRRDEF